MNLLTALFRYAAIEVDAEVHRLRAENTKLRQAFKDVAGHAGAGWGLAEDLQRRLREVTTHVAEAERNGEELVAEDLKALLTAPLTTPEPIDRGDDG